MSIHFHGNKRVFEQISRNIHRALPGIAEDIAVRAEAHYLMNFKKEGFVNRSLEKWKPRKSLGRYDELQRESRRAILIGKGSGGGKMRNATRARRKGLEVHVSNDAQSAKGFFYARIHNDGVGIMPQRQFIGDSYQLRQEITKKSIIPELKQALSLRR